MIEEEEAGTVLSHPRKEEFIHFGMDLEFLLQRTPLWRNTPACGVRNMLFKRGV